MILDATKRAEQRALLEAELEAVGIRLNRESPYVEFPYILETKSKLSTTRNIYLKPKKAGGMKITFQAPPKNLDEKMLYNILRDYKMLNCEVLVRDENGTSSFPVVQYHRTLLDIPHSNCRRFYRCNHERSQEIHQMVKP